MLPGSDPGVRFEYRISGTRYTGDRVSYGGHSPGIGAAEIAARYPLGAAVTVWYDPGQPGKAVLEPGPKLANWIEPGVGLAMVVLGTLAWFLA